MLKDKQLVAVVRHLWADCRGLCAFYLWHHRAGISFQFGKHLVLLLVEQSGRESARMCSRTHHRRVTPVIAWNRASPIPSLGRAHHICHVCRSRQVSWRETQTRSAVHLCRNHIG